MRTPTISSFFLVLGLSGLACGNEAHKEGVARAEQASERVADTKSAPPKPNASPRGPERALFSLYDNRLLAHAQRGGGVVAVAGTPGFAKYLRFAKPKISWKLHENLDGHKVAVADMYAMLEVPLSDEQAKQAQAAYVRLSSPVARRLTVNVNGKLVSTVEVAAGWQTVQVPLAPGLARTGENTVQLVFSKGPNAAVEWIQVGGATPTNEAPVVHDASKKALLLPKAGGLAYYIQVPASGRLVGDVQGEGCEVSVRVTSQGATAQGILKGVGGAVELSSMGGQIARMELSGAGCDVAYLTNASLAVPGPAPQVKRPNKPRHVILWIMDSLRADRVKPFFSEARPVVPNFERLAKTAAIFRNTYVQGNESRASHASIWSAVYPANHQMIRDGNTLGAKWTTLGEAMKGAGLYTSGVSANGYIIKRWGFGDGWDAYRNHIHDGGGVRGEDVMKLALESIQAKKDQPFFLYMGTIDTHVSWRAKEPWFRQYDPAPYNGRFVKEASGKDVEAMATGKLKVTDRDKTRIIAIYDSNVSYQDDLLGKLLEQLKGWGVADDTMVVVTADHGDEQWEDGRVGHGASLRESLVRVPLVMYYPPLFPGGIIEEGVDTIDILPTLLDALGQPIPQDVQGESLIPLAQGVGRGYPRPSIASQYEFAHGMRLAGWKVRVAGSGVPALYEIDKDPYEKNDRATERPIERRMLTDVLSTFLVYQRDWRKSRWGVPSNATPLFAADLEK
ncbi:MAG: sulfatase [Deltaproteobacteria bacterium]|nr:sulfatase [Deltaproteobacteria bacterium]